MRPVITLPFIALLLAGTAAAQIREGHVVMTLLESLKFNKGAVLHLDPLNPSKLNTLAGNATPGSLQNWVRMAPDNGDVVVSESDSSFLQSQLISFSPAGAATTIARSLPGATHGFALDGDGTWVVANQPTSLFGVQHTTGTLVTYVSSSLGIFNEVTIVREGNIRYAIADFSLSTTHFPKILAADRTGITSTVFSGPVVLNRISAIEVDPRTGDFITGDHIGPSWNPPEPNGGVEVNRVTAGGKVTTLTAFVGANCIKIDQDDTAWIGGFVGTTVRTSAIMHYDLGQNVIVSMILLPSISATQWSISGIEIYGSRVLTCNSKGGSSSTITVNLKSHKVRAAGAGYQLACSFGRRLGMKFPGGQWIHLNLLDDLFKLSSQNLAPGIFQNFAGILDASGAAKASIRLPSGFPPNLGITVFCAGVIYDIHGVIQVTNTHWFEI